MSLNMEDHAHQRKTGIIDRAWVDESSPALMVSGYLYGKDFPGAVKSISAAEDDLGMSMELSDATIMNMRGEIWIVTSMTFTGATIILRRKAAYRSTWFRIGEPA